MGKLGIQSLGLYIAARKLGEALGEDLLPEIANGIVNQIEIVRKRDQLTKSTTEYNEKTRQYLFNNPNTPIEDLINQLADLTIEQNPKITREEAVKQATGNVRGALHEVLFEYVVSDLCKSDSRFTFRRATNEEDSKGVDFYVYIDGVEFRIDIKASKYKFNNIDTDSKIERQKDGKYLLCLFTRKDESKATLDPETQTAYAEELKKILETLFENMNANKNYHNLAA